MPMFLSDEELYELTRKRRRTAQQRALNAMGIDHKVRPDGSVAVLTRCVELALGLPKSEATKQEWEPNWDAINR